MGCSETLEEGGIYLEVDTGVVLAKTRVSGKESGHTSCQNTLIAITRAGSMIPKPITSDGCVMVAR